MPWCRARGIQVFALKGTAVVNEIYASSEFTFHLMMCVLRKSMPACRAALEGNWRDNEQAFRGRELNGLTLGILGLGRIGTNLARYAAAFGMKVIGYDPYAPQQATFIARCDTVEDVYRAAEVIAVCVHLTEETFHMLDAQAFSLMKKGVSIVNTARGDVIDETALIAALENGTVAAAGLDVISNELSEDLSCHPLIRYAREHENLVITPHIAGLTYDSEHKAQRAAYEAIRTLLSTLED